MVKPLSGNSLHLPLVQGSVNDSGTVRR
jgi:hypothetical protein